MDEETLAGMSFNDREPTLFPLAIVARTMQAELDPVSSCCPSGANRATLAIELE